MGELTSSLKDTIVVTGFGSFGCFSVNSSWASVQLLPALNGFPNDVNIYVEELPVEYEYVSDRVIKLWDSLKPIFTVHCGVHGGINDICLEKCAFNNDHTRLDNCSKVPIGHCCVSHGVDCLRSRFNLEQLCADYLLTSTALDSGEIVSAVCSEDAGRYLCNFCYYLSLNASDGNAVFVHVPPLNSPYSAEQLANAIRSIILLLLEQYRQQVARASTTAFYDFSTSFAVCDSIQ